MPNVDDHGLEVLKKAARNLDPTSKRNYALQVYIVGEEGVSGGTGIVKAKKICDQSISALRICKATSANTISYASNLETVFDAQSLCVSIQAGSALQEIDVVLFGQINDGFFNFPLNAPLFLGDEGQITATPPSSGHLVNIGHSLGLGAIMINFKPPTIRE